MRVAKIDVHEDGEATLRIDRAVLRDILAMALEHETAQGVRAKALRDFIDTLDKHAPPGAMSH